MSRTASVVERPRVCDAPRGLAIDEAHDAVLVACEHGLQSGFAANPQPWTRWLVISRQAMNKIRVLLLGAAIACGGAGASQGPSAAPAASAPPGASAAVSSSAGPATSATAASTAPFALAPAQPLPPNASTKLAEFDSPALVAQRYGGATVSRDARDRALRDFAGRYASFAPMPRAARERAMVAWLGARPEIEAAGTSTTGVWARFKDGKMVVVPTYEWQVPAHHAEREVNVSSRNAKSEIPKSKAASTPDWFQTPEHANSVRWLAAHGYEGTSSALPSVAWLRNNVKNAGVFYIDSHGAEGNERDLDAARRHGSYNGLYSIMSSTRVLDKDGQPITSNSASGAQLGDLQTARASAGTDSQIDDELSHGELVYFYASEGNDNSFWHYGFTHRFVEKYFTLSENSFVYLDACSSHDMNVALLMVAAMLDKGASLVAGWTHEVTPDTALRATEFVFDRLLGANEMRDDGLHADTPKQRPWNFANTYGDLKHKGYDHETNKKGEVSGLDYTGDTEIALVPIIDEMEADDVKQLLTLHGTFGDDPGAADRHVKIAGNDCPIQEWRETKITCTMGGDFAKHGDVVVDKLGRKSNPSPLTGWDIHVEYKLVSPEKGHFGWGIDFDAHVRADVHDVRDTPADAPKAREPVGFYVVHDSTCNGGADQGNYAANGGHAWMTKGSSIPLITGMPTGGDFCIMYGQVDPHGHKLKLLVFAMTTHAAGLFHMTGPHLNRQLGFGGSTIPAPGLFDGEVPAPPGVAMATFPTGLYMTIDDHGNVQGAQRGPVDLAGNGKAKVSDSWEDVKPDDYPTDDTPQ